MEHKKILELLAICAEYCAFVEKESHDDAAHFIDKSHKILTLLYLKTAMMPHKSIDEGYCEQFVSENDWEFVKQNVQTILGQFDNMVSVHEPDAGEQELIDLPISECFADVYQDLRNFIEQYKDGSEQTRALALYEFCFNFRLYWGARILAVINEFHTLLYAANSPLETSIIVP
ncbi:MAG: DUF5063 domain-containing protein [Bacteroidales bacterium]|jgi:hypothetical protein|nr:DUF5063 domain-containing protein [Bacteroidales bacterium]